MYNFYIIVSIIILVMARIQYKRTKEAIDEEYMAKRRLEEIAAENARNEGETETEKLIDKCLFKLFAMRLSYASGYARDYKIECQMKKLGEDLDRYRAIAKKETLNQMK